MTDSMIERVARAICGNAASGFCADVGGDLGCKRGRGQSYDGTNCIASREQLMMTSHWDEARAAIEAMRTPTEAMVRATDSYDRYRAAIEDEWRLMIDAALKEKP